jgi:hypothetical protein
MIIAEAINHQSQRYNTPADYEEFANGVWGFNVSKMNIDSELALLVHELIEWRLTQKAGISEPEIARFDIESGLDDPGASRKAPYHKQHVPAERIERRVLKELGVSWKDHIEAQDKVMSKYRRKP